MKFKSKHYSSQLQIYTEIPLYKKPMCSRITLILSTPLLFVHSLPQIECIFVNVLDNRTNQFDKHIH